MGHDLDFSEKIGRLESLVVWIRQRPHNYVRTIGELEEVLHFLHEVWVVFTERSAEYDAPNSSYRADWPEDALDDVQRRTLICGSSAGLVRKVVDYWEQIDASLGIQVVAEIWRDRHLPDPNDECES